MEYVCWLSVRQLLIIHLRSERTLYYVVERLYSVLCTCIRVCMFKDSHNLLPSFRRKNKMSYRILFIHIGCR